MQSLFAVTIGDAHQAVVERLQVQRFTHDLFNAKEWVAAEQLTGGRAAHEDWNGLHAKIGRGADLTDQLQAIEHGHLDIGNDQVGDILKDELPGSLSILSLDSSKAHALHKVADEMSYQPCVINDQDGSLLEVSRPV